jgi:hypothetical protein
MYLIQRWADRYFVRWSAAQRTSEMLADQRQRTTEIELPLFSCSEIWPIFKKYLKQKKLSNNWVDTELNIY